MARETRQLPVVHLLTVVFYHVRSAQLCELSLQFCSQSLSVCFGSCTTHCVKPWAVVNSSCSAPVVDSWHFPSWLCSAAVLWSCTPHCDSICMLRLLFSTLPPPPFVPLFNTLLASHFIRSQPFGPHSCPSLLSPLNFLLPHPPPFKGRVQPWHPARIPVARHHQRHLHHRLLRAVPPRGACFLLGDH